MTLYEQVHNQLFVNGSCKFNIWYPVHLIHEDGSEIDCIACYPSKGCIKLAIKLEKPYIGYNYHGFRFNKKNELVDDGHWIGLSGQESVAL